MQPSNPNQFTEKAWEAIARTPDIVKQSQQQQLESEHLMKALLEQDGLANSLFTKAGINVRQLQDRTEDSLTASLKYREVELLSISVAAWTLY